MVDDPFAYGSISAANALSDLYAMGAKPLIALNIVGFPSTISKNILSEILKGGHSKSQEAGCIIVGGHSIIDSEPKYGLAVIGLVTPGKQIANKGGQVGDRLILTKPLGTGIITTAGKFDLVDPELLEKTIEIMTTLNRSASEAMVKIGVNAATDVTGFGLIGHLNGMLQGTDIKAKLRMSEIPYIPGVWELIDSGAVPAGTHRNLANIQHSVKWNAGIKDESKLLLCDAQTSGGLLISVPAIKVDDILKEFESTGVVGASVIGELVDHGDTAIEVIP